MVEVSVVLPVYNVAEFLPECMESILNQSFSDFELICVNDGSTDNCLEILEGYAMDDERIKIISQENAGLGAARNVGMRNSSGRYVYFVDSDDFIEPNALEVLHDNAVSNNSDVVFYRSYKYIDGEKIRSPLFNFKKQFPDVDCNDFTFTYKDVKPFVLNNGFNAWIKLYSRDFLDANPDFYFPEGIAFEDVLPHVKLMTKASRMSFVPDYLYNYRYNESSIVNNPMYAFDILKNVDMVVDYMNECGLAEEFEHDLDYFRFKRVHFHLTKSYSEEFFKKSKELCRQIKHTDLFKDIELKKYNFILESETFAEYLVKAYNLDMADMESKRQNLKKDLSRANSENKKLNRELSKAKAENKMLNGAVLKSKIGKVSKPLRNGFNFLK